MKKMPSVPSLLNPPSGCAFRTRCNRTRPICAQEAPELKRIQGGHCARCHFAEQEEISGR
jgi:oligopeptide/dipeptide ABC transporter, ATP-binding protein, C-terminal domain